MKDEANIPKGVNTPENSVFAQYHKAYTKDMKFHVVLNLLKVKPKIRLVLATVGLGMGLKAPRTV